MDSWKHSDILTMLEGGNQQLEGFFSRHYLSSSIKSNTLTKCNMYNRYQTNAAKFYKKQLDLHVQIVIENGWYKGRQYNREMTKTKTKKKKKDEKKRSSMCIIDKKQRLVVPVQNEMNGIVACQ
jgi:hypothetical protein